jgi:hypothetical protein
MYVRPSPGEDSPGYINMAKQTYVIITSCYIRSSIDVIYIVTYIHTYKQTWIHTYIQAWIHTYKQTWIHTYKHEYICTYKHIRLAHLERHVRVEALFTVAHATSAPFFTRSCWKPKFAYTLSNYSHFGHFVQSMGNKEGTVQQKYLPTLGKYFTRKKYCVRD